MQILIISSKTQDISRCSGKSMGTKPDSPLAPEQQLVVAPRGAEPAFWGQQPGLPKPSVWHQPVSHGPSAAAASQGETAKTCQEVL